MTENNSCSTCHGSCSTCHEIENPCPICGSQGLEVPYVTVENLVVDNKKVELKDKQNYEFNLCLNKACDMAYYTEDFQASVQEVKVPIWFKQNKSEYKVCYCRNITLNDIVEAVNALEKDAVTIDLVLEHLNKKDMKTDCLHNNPASLCCDRLFQSAIQYALNHK